MIADFDKQNLLRWGLFYFYCNQEWNGPEENPTLQKLKEEFLTRYPEVKESVQVEIEKAKLLPPVQIREAQKAAWKTLDQYLQKK